MIKDRMIFASDFIDDIDGSNIIEITMQLCAEYNGLTDFNKIKQILIEALTQKEHK